MNTQEKEIQLELLVEDCTTSSDVHEKVKQLSDKDKNALIYQISLDEVYEEIKEHSIDMSYLLEHAGLINDYANGVGRVRPIMALSQLGSLLLAQQFSTQARGEMQAQTEHSQFGLQLADAISDRSQELSKISEELCTLIAHYETVLLGRRMGIHFVDEKGTAVPVEKAEGSE